MNMWKIIDRESAGTGIVNSEGRSFIYVRWVLTCGHMISTHEKDCKCPPSKS